MFLRERLRPYITGLMQDAHEKGTPVIRPMFYDFPEDKKCWTLDGQYMFGGSCSSRRSWRPASARRPSICPRHVVQRVDRRGGRGRPDGRGRRAADRDPGLHARPDLLEVFKG